MNLIDEDFFSDTKNQEEIKVAIVNNIVNKDIKEEIERLFKVHGVKVVEPLISELTSIYNDSPPWKPWTV